MPLKYHVQGDDHETRVQEVCNAWGKSAASKLCNTTLPRELQACRRGVVCFTCDHTSNGAQAAAEAGESGVAELSTTPAVRLQDAARAALQATGGNQARPTRSACVYQAAWSGLCEVQGGWPNLSSCWPPSQACCVSSVPG